MSRDRAKSLKLSIVLSITALASFMDNAAITISLPHIMKLFAVSQSLVTLVPLSYTTGFACTALIFGKLCDAYGGKRVAVRAFGYLAFLSLLILFSSSFLQFVVIRFFQGVCFAACLSAVVPLYSETLPHEDMGLAYSISGIAFGLSIAAGSVMQGHLLMHYSWKSIYFFEAPLCLLTVFILQRYVPDRHMNPRGEVRLNWKGIAASSITIMLAVYAINMGPEIGWQSPAFKLLTVLTVTFLVLFIINESKTDNPLLNWEVFRIRGFPYIMGVKLLNNLCYLGMEFILPFFVVIALKDHDYVAGYLNAAAALSFTAASLLSSAVMDRYSARNINTIFLGIRGVEYAIVLALLYLGVTIPLLTVVVALIGLSGAFNVAATNKILTSYAAEGYQGSVAAVNTLLTALSGTAGIVLVNVVYTDDLPPAGHLNTLHSFSGMVDVLEVLVAIAFLTFLLSFRARENTTAS